MQRLGTRALAGRHQFFDVEVGRDRDGLVGLADMRGVAVDVGVDGDRPDTQTAQGPGHAARDRHRYLLLTSERNDQDFARFDGPNMRRLCSR